MTAEKGRKAHARLPRSLWEAPVGVLRSLAGYVLRTPERLLHARRRREALERLAALEPPRSILFVCIGNICRSPYAEHRLRRRLTAEATARITVRSAGFGRWNRPSPPEAVAEAWRRGVDLSPHRSRAVTHETVDSTELFVVTDDNQERRLRWEEGVDPRRVIHLGDLDPEPIRERTVVDPWGKGKDVFRGSYERIDRCLEVLARAAKLEVTPEVS